MKKNKIHRLLREGLLRENYFGNSTGIPDYDKLMKTDGADLKFMTLDEYLEAVAKIQNTTKDEQYSLIRPKNVKFIMSQMKAGEEFPIPYLDFSTKNQEGRHRIYAASKLRDVDSRFPVLVINPVEDGADMSDFSNFPYFLTYNSESFDGEYATTTLEVLSNNMTPELRVKLESYLKDIDGLDELLDNLDIESNIEDLSDDDLIDVLGNSKFNSELRLLEEKVILTLLSNINKKMVEYNDGQIDEDDLISYNELVNSGYIRYSKDIRKIINNLI